jgi:hypothetical protein
MDPVTKDVPTERLDHAREVQLKSFAAQSRNEIYSPLAGLGWAERGPDNVGGRTRAIMYDLNDPNGNKVWAGGVGGGLWWTNDITAGTPTWNKVSDTLNRLCITCITQSRGFTTKNKMFFGKCFLEQVKAGTTLMRFAEMEFGGVWMPVHTGRNFYQQRTIPISQTYWIFFMQITWDVSLTLGQEFLLLQTVVYLDPQMMVTPGLKL